MTRFGRVVGVGICVGILGLCSVTAARTAEADGGIDVESLVGLLELIIDVDPDSAQKSLSVITTKIQQRELDADTLARLKARLADRLDTILKSADQERLHGQAAALAATFGSDRGLTICRAIAFDSDRSTTDRIAALNTLVFVRDAELLKSVAALISQGDESTLEFRAQLLAALSRWDEPKLALMLIETFAALPPGLQPRVIELLTQRTVWSKTLVEAIGRNQITPTVLNANQVLRLLASKDEELVKLVREKWGTIRGERNPQREQVIAKVRSQLQSDRGDPGRGNIVFDKICGQCHKIYGRGQEVGPDITSNGRASFEQLLSNVLDPSLVIGASYQGRTVVTDDGRVLTGLPVEESEQRVVLKVQGGKLETIPRVEIETYQVSELSLMPEGLENQLQAQEMLDLFAYLLLDKPPDDASARFIPGTPAVQSGVK